MRSPLAFLALAALTACSPDRETGPTEHPTPARGQLLECHADAVTLVFSCAPAEGPEGAPGPGIFGDQGTNIALQSKRATFASGSQQFSVEVTVENLMGGPIGTLDGTNPSSGIDIFFLNEPSGNIGTVTVKNPSGYDDFIGSTQPYYHLPVVLDPGEKSATIPWIFQFAGGATSFTFWVLISADTPAEGAIQNWVLIPTFGAPEAQGVYGFGADGQVVYGDSGEVSYRVGGVWRSIYDTLAAPSVSGRYVFASSTRRIWNYVNVGGLRKARRWDGGNWRPMDELQGYPGQNAIGIGATLPDSIWAFGAGLWKLVDDTMWVAQSLPPGATSIRAMAPIGTDPLLVDNQGKVWLHHGGGYVAVAGVGSGHANSVSLFAVDTSQFWVLSDDPGDIDPLRRFDNGSWTTVTVPGGYARPDGYHPVMGVAISAGEAYIIANNGTHGVVLRWGGSAWSMDHENALVPYTGIWARNANEVQLSLKNGDVEVRVGGVWDPVSQIGNRPDRHTFTAAWLSAQDHGYLINDVEVLYRYSGGEPVPVDTLSVLGDATSLWSSGVNDTWIAFGGTQLWHFDGFNSTEFPFPLFNIRAVGGSAQNDVWRVGEDGHIGHFDGLGWNVELFDCGDCEDWNAVWAYDEDFAVAVGDNGQVGMWDGSDWTVTKLDTRHYYSVSGSSPGNVWIGGQTGNGWRWDGVTWEEDDLPSNRDVLGVWIPSDQEGYAIAAGESYRWNGVSWVVLDIPEMRQGKGDNRAITGAGNDAFIVGSRLFRGWR